jgi:DNA-binding response OmpR family regulator
MSNNKDFIQPDRIRILFVDDEKAFVEVIAKRLSKKGFDVTKAFSGTEALQAMRKADYDIAVLDLKMEDMDGIEVLNIFGKLAPELPVIILSGHGSEAAAKEGIKCGAMEYLTKPCDFEELVGKIKRVLKR